MFAFNRFHAIGLLVLAAACNPAPGLAQTAAPHIHVNNVHLSADEIAALAVLNCNTGVPDGDYWIDFETGVWGYAGGPQQGVMACYNASLQGQGLPAAGTQRAAARSAYTEDRMFDGMVDAFPVAPRGESYPSMVINPVYQ